MKELLKVYIFTTVFSDRYAISKINGFKFHCPCMKHSASILFIFFSIFFYYAFIFSRFRLALFLTWSILIAMETGRTVTATWYTWLVSKKNHPNLLQNKIVIRSLVVLESKNVKGIYVHITQYMDFDEPTVSYRGRTLNINIFTEK